MNLKEGATLKGGKYKILKELGSGTFGITYLATMKVDVQGPLGKMEVPANVCIKEFFISKRNSRGSDSHSVVGTDGEDWDMYRKRFRKEAENLTKLAHPNIVKVFDVFDENNTTYFVMQYVDGENLNDYLKRNHPLDESEAVEIIKTIGQALQYMHDRRILHLDLKPGNIMRSKEGEIYLIDFGLSKQFTDEGNQATTTSPVGLGTPGYAPIEQNKKKLKDGEFTPTIDVYALGAVFFKMLTCITPPEASDVANDGLPIEQLKEQTRSQYLIDTITKAMAPMKRDRYQSVGEFLNHIRIKSYQEDATELTVVSVETTKDADTPKKSELLISPPDGEINGHGYVDLGLPSGTLWATCNIGAKSPEETGDYFAWGETESKSNFFIENYGLSEKYEIKKSIVDIIIHPFGRKYSYRFHPLVSALIDLDAAKENWGMQWRMPSSQDFKELIDNCSWIFIKSNTGFMIKGPNGKTLFLAISSHDGRYGIDPYGKTFKIGGYWGINDNLCLDKMVILNLDYHFDVRSDNFFSLDPLRFNVSPYNGLPIRPVLNMTKNQMMNDIAK